MFRPKELMMVVGLFTLIYAIGHPLISDSAHALQILNPSYCPSPRRSSVEDEGGGDTNSESKTEVLRKAAHGMRSLGEAIHESKRAATKIVLEFQRAKMEVPDDAVVMGPIVIPEAVEPDLPPAGDVNPARAKWLVAYVDDLGKYLELLELETGRALLPAEKQADIDPLWIEMEASIEEARQHYLALRTLTKELAEKDEIPRKAFYSHAMHVIDAMKQIEDLRGKIYNVCKQILESEDK
ncbi:MAG: hypothetical protein R3C24_08635 [Cyanobacteriota/Melainabacteria group bacterium]|nr:hypothetical protein [Cyanobacteria bacterium HKST-UBA01]